MYYNLSLKEAIIKTITGSTAGRSIYGQFGEENEIIECQKILDKWEEVEAELIGDFDDILNDWSEIEIENNPVFFGVNKEACFFIE